MLRVRLLGGLRLEVDGAAIDPPGSRRARALLAWLALHPGSHGRRELAARFWPDVLDASARTSLRSALTELRAALGPGAEALMASRDAVGLADAPAAWVDVREQRRLLAAGRTEEALAVDGGELLAGLDDDWALAARDEHIALVGEALERLACAAERAGAHAEAARRTRAALALDPLSEQTARRLMRRLAAAGERAAALRAYEALAARLRVELAIAPSAPTRALAQEIRRAAAAPAGESAGGEPGPPAGASTAAAPISPAGADVRRRPRAGAPPAPALPPPPALARLRDAPFVGRERELERLREAWAQLTAARARRLALLSGEPGVGKTHLALRFASELAGGAVVLLGRCSDEPAPAYEPFAEILHGIERALGAGALAALAGPSGGELARLLGEPRTERDDDAGARRRLFDAVDAAMSELAAPGGLLLVVDDVGWADHPTLALLAALVCSTRPGPLLAVATDREGAGRGALARTLDELRRARAVERIALTGLDERAIAALARAALGGDEAERVAAAVARRTGGNAFLVAETLRELPERGADAVPTSVRESIAARVGALGDDAEELLAVAAVLGLAVDLGALEAVAGLEPGRAEAALDELVGAHLLRPVAGGAAQVEFPHALVREAVEEGLNPLRRRRLHRRVADALARLGEDAHLAAIAHHLERAATPGEGARVVEALARAAARALAMLAYEEAASLYSRALDALEAAGGDEPRAGRLAVARGEALLRAGEPAAARECFAAAAAVARRQGDAELLARAALGRSGLGVALTAVDDERVALLEEALAATADGDALLRSQLLARLAVELYYAPSRDRSEGLGERAVAAARATGDARALAAALNARHVALWRPDRLAERTAVADEMIAAARACGEGHLELQARNWRAVDLYEAGDVDGWRAEARRHGELAARLRLPAFAWYTPLWAATDALHRGDFEAARELRARALEQGRRAGDPNAELFEQMLRFAECMLRAEFQRVDLDVFADKVARSPAAASWRCGYAWTLAELDRRDEAREQLRAIAAGGFSTVPFDANWLSALAECAEACALLGEAELAATLLQLLRPYRGRPLTAGRAVHSYGCSSRHLAGLAAVLGRVDEAVELYREAIAADAAAGWGPLAARGRAALARTLRAAGREDRAGAERPAEPR